MKRKTLIALIWIAVWQAIAIVVGNTLLLPSLVDTIRALLGMLQDGTFYVDALSTIARCIVAMLLALALGFILSVEAYRHRIVRDILSLPVSLFKTIPIMAVAIYMILLLSPGHVPVLVCWIMCFPIVYTNLLTGLNSMDKSLLEMAQVYRISNRRKLRLIYIPSLYSYFSSAMSLIAGMSWKAIVTAEVLSIPRFSLGYELMNSKYYLNTDKLFAYVVAIVGISVAFERLIKLALTKAKPHNYEYSRVARLSDNAPRLGHSNTKANTNTNDLDILGDESEPDSAVLNNVSKSYADKVVLNNFNLTLEPGKVTAVMGPSGRGKTTIARILSGLETADSGEVNAPSKMAYLFQEDRLIPWLNVYDNLAIVMDKIDGEAIYNILKAVELEEEAWKLPGELSGGMSYRIAMARAFIYDANFLIADEPFRGLDAATKKRIIDKLWTPGIAGKTVLLITHSEDDAALADTTIYV